MSYWDPLADVLPKKIRDAMDKALGDATHHGTGREGEPILLAGVRALLEHVILKPEHDRVVRQYAEHQQAEAREHAAQLQRAAAQAREFAEADIRALRRVQQLVNVQRKTLSMTALREALNPGEVR